MPRPVKQIIQKGFPLFIILFGAGLLAYQNCGGPETSATEHPVHPICPNNSVGKDYYLVETGYTCTPMTGGQPVSSYKDHLRVESDFIILAGDKCNDALQRVPYEESVFQFSTDGQTLTYNGNTYVYSATPP